MNVSTLVSLADAKAKLKVRDAESLEEENERLKARVAELEERLFHLESRGKSDLERRIDAFLDKHIPQLDELE